MTNHKTSHALFNCICVAGTLASLLLAPISVIAILGVLRVEGYGRFSYWHGITLDFGTFITSVISYIDFRQMLQRPNHIPSLIKLNPAVTLSAYLFQLRDPNGISPFFVVATVGGISYIGVVILTWGLPKGALLTVLNIPCKKEV